MYRDCSPTLISRAHKERAPGIPRGMMRGKSRLRRASFPSGEAFRPRPSAAVRDEETLQMWPAPCGYSSAHIFETILFFLPQKEKNGFNLPRKERGPVRTVVLNLTWKILVISCPFHQSLPSERSLRSAHRLSAELHSKKYFGRPMIARYDRPASKTY